MTAVPVRRICSACLLGDAAVADRRVFDLGHDLPAGGGIGADFVGGAADIVLHVIVGALQGFAARGHGALESDDFSGHIELVLGFGEHVSSSRSLGRPLLSGRMLKRKMPCARVRMFAQTRQL